MNALIVNLRILDVGCHVNHQYAEYFLYADDIILIPTLIIGLQQILAVCSATAKSCAFKINIGPMLFGNQSLDWCHSIKYLDVHLLIGKGVFFDIAPIKRAVLSAVHCRQTSYELCFRLIAILL